MKGSPLRWGGGRGSASLLYEFGCAGYSVEEAGGYMVSGDAC